MWLQENGFEEKKDQLDEWDVRESTPGSNEPLPLEKLQAMLTEEECDEDFEDFKDMLEDLFEDDGMQLKFRAAVEALRYVNTSAGGKLPAHLLRA
eukprot:COSAG06_NODE_1972_length_7938_cov_4.377216_1_plen_95_part_00